MSGTTILVIAVPVFLLLVAVLFVGAIRRRDTDVAIGSLSRETRKRDRSQVRPLPEEQLSGRQMERKTEIEQREPSKELARVEAAPPAPWVPPDDESIGVSRRQFLNRSIVNVMSFGIGAFTLSSIAFLWPQGSGGFGSKIRIGSIDDVRAKILEGNGFAYYPEGRMWVTQYPSEALDKARQAYSAPELAGMEAGFVALYQKCVHLGCRVPQCETSQWFECPCHGSQYNQVGEKKGGPAPRGLDRFPIDISGGALTVDTGIIIQGPPIGTNTTGQEAEGPHCIGAAEEH